MPNRRRQSRRRQSKYMRGLAQYLVSIESKFSVPRSRRDTITNFNPCKPVVSSPLSQTFSIEEMPDEPSPPQNPYARLHKLLYISVCNNFPEYKEEVLKLPESWRDTPLNAAQAWRKYMEQTAPEFLVGSSEDIVAKYQQQQGAALKLIDQSPSGDYIDDETVVRDVVTKKRKRLHEDDGDSETRNISTNF
ncbi:hypothetical protein GLAREA_01925 [Glarea lozoyensis ATCC 20868]|uniref:Uncharacterized protein n=1 Tax=Glarea lozoyensis (strain ATCC 20868 / MF5171) TaxID=1116229 RepID=S3DHF1_GLAL2|nr:uncharacterized protein GLAREA_01925 [Glarea lozoyensis ATCC 20868]EPE26013.1 hypothetical protein GLAREA_01925 [Glarea lozoyensis ATCC 20868]